MIICYIIFYCQYLCHGTTAAAGNKCTALSFYSSHTKNKECRFMVLAQVSIKNLITYIDYIYQNIPVKTSNVTSWFIIEMVLSSVVIEFLVHRIFWCLLYCGWWRYVLSTSNTQFVTAVAVLVHYWELFLDNFSTVWEGWQPVYRRHVLV